MQGPTDGHRWLAAARAPWVRRSWQLLVLAACAWLLAQLDRAALWQATRQVPPYCLGLGAVGALLNLFAKGSSWWLLLPRAKRPPLGALLGIHLRGAASNIVLPLRAGEGLRIWWLKERFGLSASLLIGVALAEKALNLLSLALLSVLGAAQLGARPAWLERAWTLSCGLAAALGLAAWALQRSRLGRRAWRRARQDGPSAHWSQWLAAFAACSLGWLGDMSLVLLVAHGVGVDLPWSAAPLVLLGINVAIAVPGPPGHLGTLELAAAAALAAFGAKNVQATSFALLYHAVQILPVLSLAGLWSAWSRWRRPGRAAPATASRAAPAPPAGQRPNK